MNSDTNPVPNNEQPAASQPAPEQTAPASTPAAAPEAPKANTTMALLAYIGPLVIVSYLVAKDDPFVKFHIKQGLVLFVAEIALSLIGSMIYMLWPVINIIHIVIVILAIIGIMNAVKGKEKELPLVGKFGANFNI